MKKLYRIALAAFITISVGAAIAGLESPFTGKYIDDLVATNPTDSDQKHEGDDHMRGTKLVLQNSFPNISGAMTSNETELNYLDGVSPGVNLASKAPVLDAAKDLELGTGDVNATLINGTTITASTGFTGTLTGNVTGDVTGDLTGSVLTASQTSITDIGTQTSADINGGAIDGTPIGAASANTGKFTTLEATTSIKTALGATITDIDTAMAGSPSDAQLLTAQGIQEYVDDRPAWQFLAEFNTTSSATLGSYTTIPAGAIGLKFLFNGVSTSTVAFVSIELGWSGPTYSSQSVGVISPASTFSGGPFRVTGGTAATSTLYGITEFMKHDASHTWLGSSQLADVGDTDFDDTAGRITLSGGELTAAKVTVSTGTFDAGSVSFYALY